MCVVVEFRYVQWWYLTNSKNGKLVLVFEIRTLVLCGILKWLVLYVDDEHC